MVSEAIRLSKSTEGEPETIEVPKRCIWLIRPHRWSKWVYASGGRILQVRRCARCGLRERK